MAKVLLYNFQDERRRKKVRGELFRFMIPSREIPPADQGRTIGFLLGRDEYEDGRDQQGAPFQEEMIVMEGLSPRQFNGFLDGLKRQGIRVPLKAVVTEHNLRWTSRELRDELTREHEAMSGGKEQPVHTQPGKDGTEKPVHAQQGEDETEKSAHVQPGKDGAE